MLRDGLVDLAITSAFPGDRADPHRENEGTFDTVPLFTEPVVLALPSSHPLAATTRSISPHSPTPAGSPDAPSAAATCSPPASRSASSRASISRPTTRSPCSTWSASDLGVALLPRLALATAVVPPGATIRATSPSSDRSIRVVSLPGSRRVPAIATVLREITQLDGRDWGLRTSEALDRGPSVRRWERRSRRRSAACGGRTARRPPRAAPARSRATACRGRPSRRRPTARA